MKLSINDRVRIKIAVLNEEKKATGEVVKVPAKIIGFYKDSDNTNWVEVKFPNDKTNTVETDKLIVLTRIEAESIEIN